ncbi:MAG: hypothetical protein SF051_05095 [Elusimicrobiota bacterium]|nr:hypothetical protein [Elusimicrobiota bacterium]
MKKSVIVAAVLAAVGSSVLAHQRLSAKTLCEGFLPPNSLNIPVGDVRAAGIDEAVYNAVLDRVQAVYGPVIASKGARLSINRKWTDGTVNASAQQIGSTWHINMYGGLARHAAVTEEGFALVACHEIGHHIGGYPKSSWATNEGGSDYFATLKCMRRLYGDAPPLGDVDPVAEAGCSGEFGDESARNGCRNGARGGQSVAFLFQALRNSPTPPRFDTPNTTVVDQMYNRHPETQCRLDTYYQGALCGASVSSDLSNSDPNSGACTARNGQRVGLRPRCWYKPPVDEPALAPAFVARPLDLDAKAVAEKLEALRASLSGRGI